MKKYIFLILCSFFFTSCATWTGIKQDTSTAWDVITDISSKSWETTKDISSDAYNGTKEKIDEIAK